MYTTIKHAFQTAPVFAIATALLLSPVAQAEQICTTSCSIDVTFSGTFSDETCKVIINDATNTETVTLPTISVATLKNNGDEAGSREFYISLAECPAERTISVIFKSNTEGADGTTGNLINMTGSSYSRNVQVRIRKENGEQAKIDDISTGQDYLIPASGESVKHTYTASYYANGNDAVSSGKVRTTAAIDLIYK